MRPNYAQDAPPTEISVGGFAYPCDTDYRTWLEVLRLMRGIRPDPGSEEAAQRMLEAVIAIETLVFGGWLRDEDPAEVLRAVSEFSKGYPMAPIQDTGDGGDPAFSFEYDLNAIVVAIRNQHGVDLSYRRTEPFHWWEFLLLFHTLSGDHYILGLMEARTYRGRDRELLRRKYACALPPEYTAEEQAELDAFNAQFDTGWEKLEKRAEREDETA
jgi:hypothetical protein